MGVAVARRMNALFFAARRADLAILAYGRRLLASHGLTPARFDTLYVILRAGKCGSRSQTDIKSSLGVSAPTISRMLKSLADLGLIRRFRIGRFRRASLTPLGRAAMRRAIIDVKKPLDRAVPEVFDAAKRGLLATMDRVEGLMMCFQMAFAKQSWLLYFYEHPDN